MREGADEGNCTWWMNGSDRLSDTDDRVTISTVKFCMQNSDSIDHEDGTVEWVDYEIAKRRGDAGRPDMSYYIGSSFAGR